jgi:hypothetical protein
LLTAHVSAQTTQNNQPQDPKALAEWNRKHDLALKYRTAWDLYMALKQAARGGRQSPPAVQLPDWSGLWTSAGLGSLFRAAPNGVAPKLTQAADAASKAGQDRTAKGISYDENLSQCGPAGFPRWLQEPFLREFIVTPGQTWLINEQVQETRRIYTDGRDHTPEEERYPLVLGDSIGFWDGPKLVIHTNQLMARTMGRNAPEQSDKMEVVEIWEKTTSTRISVDVWLYDPAVYTEPWYVQRAYNQVPNPDKSLRIRYWDCSENPNNAVVKTPDGSTQYTDFTFEKKNK